MGRQRLTTAATIVALSLCVLPAGADASSTLLSGYGGPGQGNQAIIGSTLIGGAGKGAGGGGSGSSGSVSAGSASLEAPAPTSTKASGRSHAKRAHHAGKRTSAATSTPAHVSGGASSSGTPAASTAHDSGGSTLGLTGADLLYIVLAFGAVALTAVLTGRLTRRPDGHGEAQ
jgi:hypothetical protein